MLAFLVFIFLIGLLIGTSINDFSTKLPFYEQQLQNQTQAVITWLIENEFVEPEFQISNAFNPGVILNIVGDTFNQVSNLFANGFLILLTVYERRWRFFLNLKGQQNRSFFLREYRGQCF
jgi:predicted PurR-regulated permease PerM